MIGMIIIFILLGLAYLHIMWISLRYQIEKNNGWGVMGVVWSLLLIGLFLTFFVIERVQKDNPPPKFEQVQEPLYRKI